MSTQNGSHLQIRNFDSRIRIKDTTLKSSPYVCIASHAFAMFAHKNFYGCAGYTYNPLLNIAVWMPACIIWLHYGKCLREKTFMNFVILHLQKFLHEILGMPYPSMQHSVIHKMHPSYRSVKVFSLESFPLYCMHLARLCGFRTIFFSLVCRCVGSLEKKNFISGS